MVLFFFSLRNRSGKCKCILHFPEQIKSIGSATTAQIDTTGKETETECTIKQENERGLLALGGGR